MKKPHEILSTSLETFELLYWKGQPLYQYFPRIKSYISTNLGEDYSYLLAQPKLVSTGKGATSISWQSDKLTEKAIPFSESDNPARYEAKIDQIRSFVSNLLTSNNPDDNQWGELLQLCLSDIGENSLFVEEERIVIAAWGVKPLNPVDKALFSTAFIPKEGRSNDEPSSEDNRPEVSAEESALSTKPKEILTTEDKEFLEETHEEESHQSGAAKKNAPTEANSDKNPKPAFILGKYWWAILLLLILGIVIWRACSTQNPQQYLPPESNVIIPIDSNDVVIDEDSIRMIASDRLNILLKGSNKDLDAFAKAFKSEYAEDIYTIIYFDTLTSRMQIRVPTEKREQLIDEIPQRLSQFEMLIWHESIFERNARPSEPGFGDQNKAWYFDVIKVKGAWDKSFGDPGIVVAVLDDGFDLSHIEFSGKVVKPWNVLDRSINVFTNKRSIHGSHVAGTAVGARDNKAGLSGIAPDCKLMPIQVASKNGVISATAVVDGVLYAINQGADVINLSLGLRIDPRVASYPVNVQRDIIANSFHSEEAFWKEILNIAEENGVVVVMAGGNNDVLIGLDPMQRGPLGIKVSAIDNKLAKAKFSNYGDYSTLSAPGVNIYSSIPGNRFEYLSGTSMAAPIVAGAVAILKSNNPALTPGEIRNILVNTALPLSNEIGPLLQLDKALAAVNDEDLINDPIEDEDCLNIQLKIDSLLQEIERLKNLCPDGVPMDTMKMPEIIEDLDFSIGRWKSTTYIHNNDGEEVTIYFDFYPDRTGKITLVEPDGLKCIANLRLNADRSSFTVDQLNGADCAPIAKIYSNYTFVCQADVNGYAECTAQNKQIRANRFNFKLIKIQ